MESRKFCGFFDFIKVALDAQVATCMDLQRTARPIIWRGTPNVF